METDWQGEMSRESAHQLVLLEALSGAGRDFFSLGAIETKRTRSGQKVDGDHLASPVLAQDVVKTTEMDGAIGGHFAGPDAASQKSIHPLEIQ